MFYITNKESRFPAPTCRGRRLRSTALNMPTALVPLTRYGIVLFLSGFHALSLPIGVLGCSVSIVIGMVYDGLTRRAVHPAYWIGLIALLAIEVSLLPQVKGDAVVWINEGLAVIGERLGTFNKPESTVEF